MSGYRVVPAEARHAEAIREIALAVAWSEETADPDQGYLVSQRAAEEYARLIERCPACRVAIDAADRVVGFLIALPGEDLPAAVAALVRGPLEAMLLIDQIGVLPPARGSGVAQGMLEAAAVAGGRPVVGAEIMHEPQRNRRSLRFFTEKNGFGLAGSYRDGIFTWGYYEKNF